MEQALLPNYVCTRGTSMVPDVDDCSRSQLIKDEVGTSLSVLWAGFQPLTAACIMRRCLYLMW